MSSFITLWAIRGQALETLGTEIYSLGKEHYREG
jgi:hypothetical protein